MMWLLLKWFLAVWLLSGWAGFVLYMMNPNTRPSKKKYIPFAVITFSTFGLMALMYGKICWSGRKLQVEEANRSE
jgi:hypothetical protein